MRVISGSAKGRRLAAVPGDSTRPILDRVKTTLFDIIQQRVAGRRWLDLFAGSGSVGIEALSRGAAFCNFTDIEKTAVQTITANLEACNLSKLARVQHLDAFSFIKNSTESFDLIYIAPPQYKNLWIEAIMALAERPHLLNKDGEVIVQIDPKEHTESDADFKSWLKLHKEKKIGNTLLLFYRR